MRLLVVGATGFVGRALIARALAQGDSVVALVRDAGKARLDSRVRSVVFALEGEGRAALPREVHGADAVVNLAGAGVMDRAWTDARKRELVASRVDVTRAVAEAAASAGRSLALVNASAVGIYGARRDGALLREDSLPGTDFLAELCREWEAAALAAAASGVRVVCARFGIVLGAGGGALAEMVKPFRLHAGGPLGDGTQWVSWIHIDDAVAALDLAIRSQAMEGPVNVVAPSPVTMQEQAQAIADVLGTHALARVPAFVLRAVLGSERANVVLTGQRVSAERLLSFGLSFRFPELRPALRDILGSP